MPGCPLYLDPQVDEHPVLFSVLWVFGSPVIETHAGRFALLSIGIVVLIVQIIIAIRNLIVASTCNRGLSEHLSLFLIITPNMNFCVCNFDQGL